MQQVNTAQEAIKQVGEAFEDLATNNVTDGLQTQIDQKVPQTRTINGQPLSEDISLNAEDVGADSSGAAAAVQTNLSNHASNTTLHATRDEKDFWNLGAVQQLSYLKSGNVHYLYGMQYDWTAVSAAPPEDPDEPPDNPPPDPDEPPTDVDPPENPPLMNDYISCVFKATAAFNAGDRVKVNGETYTIQLSNGETPEDNLFVSGAMVAAVIDRIGKKVNFKSAGGKKPPAEVTMIAAFFMENGTFTVPQDGKYRVTVIGKGGAGGSSTGHGYTGGQKDGTSTVGPGGGTGGAAWKTMQLTKSTQYAITVDNSNSSFGNILSATAGETRGGTSGVGGAGGTATGGDVNITGTKGDDSYTRTGISAYSITSDGRVGAVFSTAAQAQNKFLQSVKYGSAGTMGSVNVPTLYKQPYYPFGWGGSTGGCVSYLGGNYDTDYLTIGLSGGSGCFGAVIIEYIVE